MHKESIFENDWQLKLFVVICEVMFIRAYVRNYSSLFKYINIWLYRSHIIFSFNIDSQLL